MPAPLHCRNCGAPKQHDTFIQCAFYWRGRCQTYARKNTALQKRIAELEKTKLPLPPLQELEESRRIRSALNFTG